MPPQVCPRCQSEVPATQSMCDRCGASLTSTALVPYPNAPLVPVRPRLPAPLRQAVAPVVAVSLLGLGLRLARAWLRYRRHGPPAPALKALTKRQPPPAPPTQSEVAGQIVVIQRTVQTWVVMRRPGK